MMLLNSSSVVSFKATRQGRIAVKKSERPEEVLLTPGPIKVKVAEDLLFVVDIRSLPEVDSYDLYITPLKSSARKFTKEYITEQFFKVFELDGNLCRNIEYKGYFC